MGEQAPDAPIAADTIARAVASLSASLTPASPKHVAACLARLAVGTKSQPGDAADWKTRASVYAGALQGYPADIWDSVTERALGSMTWWPAVAELATLLRQETDERRSHIRRLEWLRTQHKPEIVRDPRPPESERQAQIARWREAFGKVA